MPSSRPSNPFARSTASKPTASRAARPQPVAAGMAASHATATARRPASAQPQEQVPGNVRNIHEEMCREWREAEAAFKTAREQRIAARKLQAELEAEVKAEREAAHAAAQEASRQKRILEEQEMFEKEQEEAMARAEAAQQRAAERAAAAAAADAARAAREAQRAASARLETPSVLRHRVFIDDDPDNLWGAPRSADGDGEFDDYGAAHNGRAYTYPNQGGYYNDYYSSASEDEDIHNTDEEEDSDAAFFASWDSADEGSRSADAWWDTYGDFFNDASFFWNRAAGGGASGPFNGKDWGGFNPNDDDSSDYYRQKMAEEKEVPIAGQGMYADPTVYSYRNPRRQPANGSAFVSGEHAARAAAAAVVKKARDKKKLEEIDEAQLEEKIADKVASVVKHSGGDVAMFAAQLKVHYKSVPSNKESTKRNARRAVLLTFHPDKLQQSSRKDQLLGLYITKALNSMT